MCAMLMVRLVSKSIKPLEHLRREWRGWRWVPLGIVFGYAYGILRLYALVTIRNVAWSGGSGIKVTS